MSDHLELQKARSTAGWIRQGRRALAAGAVERLQGQREELVTGYGQRGFSELVTDTEIRLEYLISSLRIGSPELFADHVAWLRASFAARGLSDDFLQLHLDAIEAELRSQLPDGTNAPVLAIFGPARRALSEAETEPPSLLDDQNPHVRVAREYLLAVLEGRRRDAETMVLELFEAGVSIGEIERFVVGAAQRELGRMWQVGEIHPAEEHAATRIAEGIGVLLRSRVKAKAPNGKSVLLASVGGNDHDLAIRILADRLELEGWHAICLGADSPADSIAQAADDLSVDLVALAATTALHVEPAEAVVRALRAMPGGDHRPILIGGRPFEVVPDLHKQIGADETADTLEAALETATRLVS
ncbi:MAG: cobalamin-dependent protein [Planctomycetota bacterium]